MSCGLRCSGRERTDQMACIPSIDFCAPMLHAHTPLHQHHAPLSCCSYRHPSSNLGSIYVRPSPQSCIRAYSCCGEDVHCTAAVHAGPHTSVATPWLLLEPCKCGRQPSSRLKTCLLAATSLHLSSSLKALPPNSCSRMSSCQGSCQQLTSFLSCPSKTSQCGHD